jgi:transaldolase
MSGSYFSALHRETENRFWINNPTGEELDLAIRHGAIACTTNPAYCSRLLSVEPEFMNRVIDETVDQVRDVEAAAMIVYQKAVQRLMRGYMPVYGRSGGAEGFVTMQFDPRNDECAESTIANVRENARLGANYMAKIPVIEGAMEAIEYCVEENIPICATEVFSIAQARAVCECYEAAAKRGGNRPPLLVTHITGIFDEYLKKLAKREGIDIAPETLAQAGLAIARKEYRMLRDAGSSAIMLGGGAREPHHFTGLIGGKVHITINWSTAEEIIKSGMGIEPRLDDETPPAEIEKLRSAFLDFRKAYDDDGLVPAEFASFGPVQLFRNAFLKGWYHLLSEIASRKHARAL